MKEQQALEREREVAERAERAAARQQQKLDAETAQKKAEREQKKIEAAKDQKRLEIKAAREKEKREAEMAAEKEKREADMTMERERREAEMELRKIAMEEERMRIEAVAAQKELDAKVQKARIKAGQDSDPRRSNTSGNGVSAKVLRLPVFHDDKDDLDVYIERFERFATTHHWPRESWASSLSALITGRALEVYSRLSADEADDFDVLKKALLDRYHLNAEGFRMKLRDSIAYKGESPAQFITRLENYLNRLIELTKIPKTFAGMLQLILNEQFISTCSNDLATFLKERTWESLKDLGETGNKYLEAHGKQIKDVSKKTNLLKSQNSSSGKLTCSYCHRMGHTVKECRTIKKQAESSDVQQQGSSRVECRVCNRKLHKSRDCKKLDEYRDAVSAGAAIDRNNVKCFFCDQIGHIVRDCPKKWRKNDKVGCGQEGEDDVSDSECGAMAHVTAVNNEDTSEEDNEVSGVVWTISEAKMPVSQGKVGKYEVQTVRDTGCSCVVVKKFVEDRQLTGKTRSIVLVLGTRDRLSVAKIHVDTPYLKGEVEALCAEEMLYDLVIGNVHGARDPDDPDLEWEEREAMETLAEKKEDLDVKSLKTAECQDTEPIAVNYLELQEENVSLNRLRRMTGTRRKRNTMSWFQTENGILYRVFQSPRVNKGKPVKHVVLPRVSKTRYSISS